MNQSKCLKSIGFNRPNQPLNWVVKTAVTVLVLFFSACAKNDSPPSVGFYYWKTLFKLNQVELAAIDSLKAQNLYIRIFDVDWNFNEHQAIPKGTQSNSPIFPQGIDPVPTIYITNRTFLHISDVDSLAQKILDYSSRILNQWPLQPTKIQIDVDWTALTKDKYFELLQYIKAKGPFEKVSTTIRLHQYKYPKKTGIPPVDEGVLMCYNTGKIREWATENSIVSLEDVTKYVDGAGIYPLKLGVALPIFSWTIIFRDSSFYKIVSDNDLGWQQDTVHYQEFSPNHFVVKSNTFLKGHYLYEDDLLRYESVSLGELGQVAQKLSNKQHFSEILFYHLDEGNLGIYSIEDLQKLRDFF